MTHSRVGGILMKRRYGCCLRRHGLAETSLVAKYTRAQQKNRKTSDIGGRRGLTSYPKSGRRHQIKFIALSPQPSSQCYSRTGVGTRCDEGYEKQNCECESNGQFVKEQGEPSQAHRGHPYGHITKGAGGTDILVRRYDSLNFRV